MKPDPMGEDRNSFQVFLLILAAWGSLTVIAPGDAASGSIEKVLAEPYETLWGITLLTGSVATLAGMYWQGDARTGLVMKHAGLWILTWPIVVFALVVWIISGWGGTIIGMTLLAFAFTAAWQGHRVGRRVHAAKKPRNGGSGRGD